jgi:hypothetical protein
LHPYPKAFMGVGYFGFDYPRIHVDEKVGEALHRGVHSCQDIEYMDGRVFDGLKDVNNQKQKRSQK